MSTRMMGFVRHGDYEQLDATPSAHQPFALNNRGVQQATEAAIKLKQLISAHDWQLLPEFISSNMLRAWQTAQIFSQQINPDISIRCEDALAERSVGAVANLSLAQIEQIITDDPRYASLPHGWKSDSYFRLPFQGAESLMEAGNRVADFIQKEMSQIPVQETAQLKMFFGHGASFRHAAYQLGILDFNMIAKLSMYHAEPMIFEYLGPGEWKHISGEWKLRQPKGESID